MTQNVFENRPLAARLSQEDDGLRGLFADAIREDREYLSELLRVSGHIAAAQLTESLARMMEGVIPRRARRPRARKIAA